MKYLAHLERSLDSPIVSIIDVYNGLNSREPEKWEGREYYSLWYLTPMIARASSKIRAPHFAYKSGFGGNENSGGGESIEHDLSKKTIFDLKKLFVKIWNKEDYLYFSDIKIEYPFEKRIYVADLYAKIKNENKFGYPVGTYLAIELHWTNKVKMTKRAYYRKNNIAAIQIDLDKSIQFRGDLTRLQAQTNLHFQGLVKAKSLHDPNYIQNKIKKDKAEAEMKKKQQELAKKKEEALRSKALQLIADEMKTDKIADIQAPVLCPQIILKNQDNEVLGEKLSWIQKIIKLIFRKN